MTRSSFAAGSAFASHAPMPRLARRSFLALAAFAGAAHAQPAAWRDAARDRTLPMLLRLPGRRAPAPAVLLSHGLGGSREGLAYLGTALAEAGFVAIHMQHPGTDAELWRNGQDRTVALGSALLDVRNALDRLLDVAFVLDTLADRPELRGYLDARRIAIAGHSFGAWTVQHMLGQRLPTPRNDLPTLPDPRLGAGISLSPTGAFGLPPRLAFARLSAPILYVTGTLDRGYIEGATPEDRKLPYRSSTAPAGLAVLDGAMHASFADEPAAGSRWADSTYHARTAALSVAFPRAVLLKAAAARRSLLAAEPLGPNDRFEARGL